MCGWMEGRRGISRRGIMSILKRWIKKKGESSIVGFFVYNVFNGLVILDEKELFWGDEE